MPIVDLANDLDLKDIVESDPAVVAAKENIAAAQSKLHEARRSLGPTVSLYVRRDYLGESVDSFGEANRHIAPYDSEIGLSFQQELFPFTSEVAQIDKASAEVRKAQAQYEQAQLETETKLRGALSAQREAEDSYVAAKRSLAESERVLDLTESLYHAGRTDLDNVDHARMDRGKAQAEVRTLESRRTFAEWAAARVLEPDAFPSLIFGQLHLEAQAQQWRREH
jgi:outer membrane protein TolC